MVTTLSFGSFSSTGSIFLRLLQSTISINFNDVSSGSQLGRAVMDLHSERSNALSDFNFLMPGGSEVNLKSKNCNDWRFLNSFNLLRSSLSGTA